MSSDSMWSDYEVDYLFSIWGEDRVIRNKQKQMKACVPDATIEHLDRISKNYGSYTFWSKHGLFRAYFKNGTYYSLNPSWLEEE